MQVTYHSTGIKIAPSVESTEDGAIYDLGMFIPLKDIIYQCHMQKILEQHLALLTIEWPSSRGFDGIKEEITLPLLHAEALKDALLGKTIYFGEINGKHSDISGTIEENEIKISIDPKEVVEKLGHTYTYSFIYYFLDYATNVGYPDVTPEQLAFLKSLLTTTNN